MDGVSYNRCGASVNPVENPAMTAESSRLALASQSPARLNCASLPCGGGRRERAAASASLSNRQRGRKRGQEEPIDAGHVPLDVPDELRGELGGALTPPGWIHIRVTLRKPKQ